MSSKVAAENNRTFLPLHGGDIAAASQYFNLPQDQWLDLSTGMNPCPYPINAIPAEAFYQLPYVQSEFTQAVYNYYGEHRFLSLCGSQAAIQNLPEILSSFPVLLPSVGYQEHQLSFAKAGNTLHTYNAFSVSGGFADIQQALQENSQQHVVLIQPNNPSGKLFSFEQLQAISQQLADGAYLIVDEAFIDLTPQLSLLNETLPHNVIVLRSFGKFFGLAGVRLGFVFANAQVLQALEAKLSLWQLNGPAQAVAIQALNDIAWQKNARATITQQACQSREIFSALMSTVDANVLNGCDLFTSYQLDAERAKKIYLGLAEQGILIRLVELANQQVLLRIGLHAESDSLRIKKAIANVLAAV